MGDCLAADRDGVRGRNRAVEIGLEVHLEATGSFVAARRIVVPNRDDLDIGHRLERFGPEIRVVMREA